MINPIKVLIADDTAIAREGLRGLLQTASDFEIVGEAVSVQEVSSKTLELNPDTVLMDLRWFGDDTAGSSIIREIKSSRPQVKVIAMTAFELLIADAYDAGADVALEKAFSRRHLHNLIRRLCRDDKELSAKHVHDLARIRPGRTDARVYEESMYEILEFLLTPGLTNPRWQSRTWLGTRIRDVVFFNGSDHPLWQAVRTQHGSDQVVFELKNTAQIEPEHVDQLGGYLVRSLGRLGILLGRHAPSESVWLRQVTLYNGDDKVVLVMWDEHIRTMLSLKAAGADPVELIQDLYVEFKRRAQ